jgi:hypothetical protein
LHTPTIWFVHDKKLQDEREGRAARTLTERGHLHEGKKALLFVNKEKEKF